jgi:hypothetical protein
VFARLRQRARTRRHTPRHPTHTRSQQAGLDEYGLQAADAKQFEAHDGAAVDPWRCLHACDTSPSCLAVSTAKVNGDWACWLVDGSFLTGVMASGAKAAASHINSYLWAWDGHTPPVSSHVSSVCMAALRGALSHAWVAPLMRACRHVRRTRPCQP